MVKKWTVLFVHPQLLVGSQIDHNELPVKPERTRYSEQMFVSESIILFYYICMVIRSPHITNQFLEQVVFYNHFSHIVLTDHVQHAHLQNALCVTVKNTDK